MSHLLKRNPIVIIKPTEICIGMPLFQNTNPIAIFAIECFLILPLDGEEKHGAVIIYMSLYQTKIYSNHFPTIFFLRFAVGVYYTHIFITRKKNHTIHIFSSPERRIKRNWLSLCTPVSFVRLLYIKIITPPLG